MIDINRPRYRGQTNTEAEFVREVLALCVKYNISISHEDNQGSFILCEYNDVDNIKLLKASVEMLAEED